MNLGPVRFCGAILLDRELVLRLLLITFFLYSVSFQGYSQRAQMDSLRKILPTLHDSARVKCLNMLSLAYSYIDVDTAESFAQKAFLESSSIDYQVGKVVSLNNKAHIAGYGHRDFKLQEKLSKEAIQFHGGFRGSSELIDSYMNLALSLFCQGQFERSSEVCNEVVKLSESTGNRNANGEAIALLGSLSFESGNYEKSFDYFNRSLSLFKSINESHNTAIVLAKLGDIYRLAGDRTMALNLYNKSLEYKKSAAIVWRPLVDIGDTYYLFEQYDTPSNDQDTYLQSIKLLTIRTNSAAFAKVRMAEKLLVNKKYDQAITLLKDDLTLATNRHDTNYVLRLLLDMSNAYLDEKKFLSAFHTTRDLLNTAKKHNAKQYLRDGFYVMYSLFDGRNVDSAYHYYRAYTQMKDSVALDEFGKKLAIYKAASENEKAHVQIDILNKEKQIREQQLEIRDRQLQNQSYIKNILLIGLLFLLLLGFLLFRYFSLKQKNEAHRNELIEKELNLQKLESEKITRELQQRALELEMQALRAQMNPHFIFNSLNSINRFILQNNKAQASEYLTKFSRLVRMILQNSQLTAITLEVELEALQLYLELEAVRFDHHFEYKVNVDLSLDVATVKVPPLIIQPYAENAIWHGLMHKEEKGGLLQIELKAEDDLLSCKIIDNGIGRKKAMEYKSKSASSSKSLGMRITAERIAMMHKKKEMDIYVSVNDLVLPGGQPAGTEVCLKIPVQYD